MRGANFELWYSVHCIRRRQFDGISTIFPGPNWRWLVWLARARVAALLARPRTTSARLSQDIPAFHWSYSRNDMITQSRMIAMGMRWMTIRIQHAHANVSHPLLCAYGIPQFTLYFILYEVNDTIIPTSISIKIMSSPTECFAWFTDCSFVSGSLTSQNPVFFGERYFKSWSSDFDSSGTDERRMIFSTSIDKNWADRVNSSWKPAGHNFDWDRCGNNCVVYLVAKETSHRSTKHIGRIYTVLIR